MGFVSYFRNTIIEFINLLVKFRITSVYCLLDTCPELPLLMASAEMTIPLFGTNARTITGTNIVNIRLFISFYGIINSESKIIFLIP